MNREQYLGDSRYERVLEHMDLLGIMDITTTRQHKNGTIVWKLPIKNNHRPTSMIEVASFSTGYVRNQNSGYSNYQLNKRCEGEPEYYETAGFKPGETLYRKFTTRSCVLIPIEIDRLEYLISYCLKNYYIKRANQVVEGKYVSKWYHHHMLENANSPTVTRNLKKISELHDRIYELESQVDVADTRVTNLKLQLEKVKRECNQAYECGLSDGKTKANDTYSENTGAMARINDLEEKLDAMTEDRDIHVNEKHSLENKLNNAISPTKHECAKQYSVKLEEKIIDLQDKLKAIHWHVQRIADHG